MISVIHGKQVSEPRMCPWFIIKTFLQSPTVLTVLSGSASITLGHPQGIMGTTHTQSRSRKPPPVGEGADPVYLSRITKVQCKNKIGLCLQSQYLELGQEDHKFKVTLD